MRDFLSKKGYMTMLKLRDMRAVVAAPMVAAMLVASVPVGVVRAELVTTGQVLERTGAEAERARVSTFLSRDEIRDRLVSIGVNPEEAARRVGGMSDTEVLQVAEKIENLPAGQGRGRGVSIVVVLLLVIILILAI